MKNLKVFFTFMIVGLLMGFSNVKAQVELSDEEYNNLRKLFSQGRIAVMTEEEVDKYLSYDFENITTAHKYYKVTETTNGTTSSEVSEAEATLAINSRVNARSDYHETTYKHISISTTYIGGNKSEVFLYTEWLVTPATKSFDVTGIRLYDGTVVDGTQDGTQTYWTSTTGNYDYVDYSWNGTNIVKATNGFGISMNLVDSGSYFATDITADVIATSQFAEVFGSYQHAVTNLTLAQSQSYTISHNGYGGVFNFATGVQNYYDGMTGVSTTLQYNG